MFPLYLLSLLSPTPTLFNSRIAVDHALHLLHNKLISLHTYVIVVFPIRNSAYMSLPLQLPPIVSDCIQAMASNNDTFPTASSNVPDEYLHTSHLPVTPPGNYINVDDLGNNTDIFGSAPGAPDRRVFFLDASLSPEIVCSIDLEDPFFIGDRPASNSSVPSKVVSNVELADPFFVGEYSARKNPELIMSSEGVAERPAEQNTGLLCELTRSPTFILKTYTEFCKPTRKTPLVKQSNRQVNRSYLLQAS